MLVRQVEVKDPVVCLVQLFHDRGSALGEQDPSPGDGQRLREVELVEADAGDGAGHLHALRVAIGHHHVSVGQNVQDQLKQKMATLGSKILRMTMLSVYFEEVVRVRGRIPDVNLVLKASLLFEFDHQVLVWRPSVHNDLELGSGNQIVQGVNVISFPLVEELGKHLAGKAGDHDELAAEEEHKNS